MKATPGWMCFAVLVMSCPAWSQDRGLDAPEPSRVRKAKGEADRRAEVARRELTTLDRGASINPRLLEVVQDNTLNLQYEERDVYFRMLQMAQETPLSRQEEFAADFREERRLASPRYAKRKPSEFQPFVDLFQNPDEYRGRPVSLHGVLRKLTKFDPGQNTLGIEEAYEGWLYTDDAQSNPTVVVFTGKPQNLPVGGDLAEEIRVTGYFLKLYGYEAQEATRTAPLLLAGEVEWRPGPEKYLAKPLSLETYLLVGFIVLLGGYAMWQTNRREMTGRPRPQSEVDFSRFPPTEYSRTTGPSVSETDDA
ncbi:MAG: hypothetical protein AABP62_16450 [Planctomycetota bacterium]